MGAEVIYRYAALLLLALLASCASFDDVSRQATATVYIGTPETGHGSGVIVGPNRVLTAYHVVSDVSPTIVFADGTKREANPNVVWAKEKLDLALIEVDTTGFAPAPIDCRPQSQGTQVVVYGNPLKLPNIATWGHIASRSPWPGEDARDHPTDILDVGILPGNSGGGVFLPDGKLVGIIQMVAVFRGSATGLGMAIPSSAFCSLL